MLNSEYRLYDPRLAQWLTRDPVFQPWESPYSAIAGNPILFADPQGLDDAKVGTEDNPKVLEQVEVTAQRPPESVIANDKAFNSFLNNNKITPPINDWRISAPSAPNQYQQIMGGLRDYADDKYDLNKSHFTLNWLVATVVHSSLDALQVTTTNIFHKLHLTELPARHLDNTYANDNQVRDAGVNMVIEGVTTFGAGNALKLVTKGAGAVDNVAGGALKAADDVAGEVAEEVVTYSDDLVKAAEKLYPNKIGKFEKHHPFPKYMGGAEKQNLIELPAAYHQQITNEFFKYWPKKLPGQPKVYPTAEQAQEIMQKVYSKFPLPDN